MSATRTLVSTLLLVTLTLLGALRGEIALGEAGDCCAEACQCAHAEPSCCSLEESEVAPRLTQDCDCGPAGSNFTLLGLPSVCPPSMRAEAPRESRRAAEPRFRWHESVAGEPGVPPPRR